MSALLVERINQIDLVGFLAFLEHHPETISGAHYWYASPFASTPVDGDHFHVNRRTNRWYDFHAGSGSTMADFGARFFPDEQLFIKNLRAFLATTTENVLQPGLRALHSPIPKIRLEATYPIKTLLLTKQLWERRIPLSVAQRYCQEARYTRDDRSYCALVFPTDAHGQLLFNKTHRFQLGPDSPTLCTAGKNQIAVFLDCLDLLTLASLEPAPRLQPDLLCLNQPGNLATILPKLTTYSTIRLFLPNTTPGDNLTTIIQENYSTAIDYRPLYNRYSSLNEWVCHIGKGSHPKIMHHRLQNPIPSLSIPREKPSRYTRATLPRLDIP